VVSSLQVGCQKDQDIDSQHAGLPGGQRADVPSEYVVASAAKHLQAATLAQHLQLPDLRAQQNPFSTLLDTSGSRSSAGNCVCVSNVFEQADYALLVHQTRGAALQPAAAPIFSQIGCHSVCLDTAHLQTNWSFLVPSSTCWG
jgi:hypothetical protein